MCNFQHFIRSPGSLDHISVIHFHADTNPAGIPNTKELALLKAEAKIDVAEEVFSGRRPGRAAAAAARTKTADELASSAVDIDENESNDESDHGDPGEEEPSSTRTGPNIPKQSPSKPTVSKEACISSKKTAEKAGFNSLFAPKKSTVVKSTKMKPTTIKATNADTRPPLRDESVPITAGPVVAEDYNPAKKNYDPVADACWAKGNPVTYAALSKTFEVLEEQEGSGSALLKADILRNFFRSILVLCPTELPMCIYLCSNKLGPAYEGLELGIGDAILFKAVSEATGTDVKFLKEQYEAIGDLGNVAQQSKGRQSTLSFGAKPKPLMVSDVFKKLIEIAKMEGAKSGAKKIEIIRGLLRSCKGPEVRYLIRSLSGKLRINTGEVKVITAIAHAMVYNDPHKKTAGRPKGISDDAWKTMLSDAMLKVKQAYAELPNFDKLIEALMKYPLDDLADHISITPGIPLKPMLAKPTKGIDEVLKRFEGQEYACEWKYDGERAQVHMTEEGKMHIYSRNQEDNTSKYPDIIGRFPNTMVDGVTSFIIDCEAVAYDLEKEAILPFQVLTTRKRKDANAGEIKVQVCLYPFDLLYLNGKSYVKESFGTRRKLLRESFKETKGQLHFATSHVASDVDEIAELLDRSIKENCEGLMVKTLNHDATYDIATRSNRWLKLKKDYLDGVGDTLDLVPVGAWIGRGKRTGTYGAFLLACYDPDSEEYQSICKIGTGFTEEDLKTHYASLKQHVSISSTALVRVCAFAQWQRQIYFVIGSLSD